MEPDDHVSPWIAVMKFPQPVLNAVWKLVVHDCVVARSVTDPYGRYCRGFPPRYRRAITRLLSTALLSGSAAPLRVPAVPDAETPWPLEGEVRSVTVVSTSVIELVARAFTFVPQLVLMLEANVPSWADVGAVPVYLKKNLLSTSTSAAEECLSVTRRTFATLGSAGMRLSPFVSGFDERILAPAGYTWLYHVKRAGTRLL